MRFRLSLISALLVAGLTAGTARANGGPIMPLSVVQPGMNCTGYTVVQGTTISSFNVHVIAIVEDPVQGPRILISVSGPAVDPTGVAEGFSGSPIYCQDPSTGVIENAGAISEGVGQFGNHVAEATPIQQMLNEPLSPPTSVARIAVRGRPLLGPLMFGGLSPALIHVLQRAGRRAGRTVLASPASPPIDFPVQQLVPGASVSVSYSSGAVPVGAIGTVTYRDGQSVWAFGHELDGVGRRSLLLQDAYVYYVVNNPSTGADTSYKLAVPGHTIGTLTDDTPNAVVGAVGAAPAQTPVNVTAHNLDTGQTVTLDTEVADETDLGNPLGSSLVSLVAPIAVAQAATQVFNGPPANESGDMCVTVKLRETPRPLHFCNRYVGTGTPGDQGQSPPFLANGAGGDVATALGLIDQISFAAIHLTSVSVSINAQDGLAEASMVSVHARTHVRAGQRVTIHLRARLYRGPLRTFSFRVRIPRHVHGRLVATIRNATSAQSTAQALAQAIAQALGGAFAGLVGQPPGSIAQLRRAFDATGNYDGLTVRFGSRNRVPAYRNARLLITGRVKLTFRVRR